MNYSVDPFDIRWKTSDPLDREITLLNSVAGARESTNKHTGEEFLSLDEVKQTLEDPDRIDLTQKSPRHREIYYKTDSNEYPHKRVVVEFNEDEKGVAISWSRYKQHVSCVEIVYSKSSDHYENI